MIGLCSFINHESIGFYRGIYYKEYCDRKKPIITFDGIQVFFYRHQFEHAFYESNNRKQKDKSQFSYIRANRIHWIKWTLQNPDAELYCGIDKTKRNYINSRRVAITFDNYVVIIEINSKDKSKALFITAFLADGSNGKGESTISSIKKGPKWK